MIHFSSRESFLVMTSTRFQNPASGAVPVSFCVLGFGEEVHWASLALMECLRARGYRITGLMPQADDAQWREGGWRSVRVKQLQGASSFEFPASALCSMAQREPPEPREQLAGVVDVEAVVDSFAALATWVDLVVVDALGEPAGGLAPNMGDVAQALGLPVVIACEDTEEALQKACKLVYHLRARKLRVVAWVQSGLQPMACAAGIPCVGSIPAVDLPVPARAARHVDAMRLLEALLPEAGPRSVGVSANARKTGDRMH